MNYLGKFPHKIQSQIKHIENLLSPYTKRAYLVGGCVRDMLLGNDIKDLDIEVYDISPEDFDDIMSSIGALGVGKSFFVYKLGDIDLALPRIEKKIGVGHKAFEVKITDDEKIASKRRDFTMNAMMVNIFNGKLLDFHKGQKSLIKKMISLIDENSFKEDSLRVLRAIQFSARFGFEIDDFTLKIMNDICLDDLSKTRIFWELEKLFNADFLEYGFAYMYRLDIFEKIFTCKISSDKCKEIKAELVSVSKCFREDLREFYFLYIIANMLKVNPRELLKSIDAPNRYLHIMKYQPYFEELPSDKELAIVAIDLPIKDWLGNYKEDVVKRAKELDIYDTIYYRGIDIQDVIADGFENKDIKIEYRRRVLEKIEKEFCG